MCILVDKMGADVNHVKAGYNETMVMRAASEGKIKCLSKLVKAGADVNLKNKDRDTALILAADGSHGDCIDLLLKAGASVNTTNGDGLTALFLSVAGPSEDDEQLKSVHKCLTLLLKAGADVNIINENNSTALMKALDNEYGESAIALSMEELM